MASSPAPPATKKVKILARVVVASLVISLLVLTGLWIAGAFDTPTPSVPAGIDSGTGGNTQDGPGDGDADDGDGGSEQEDQDSYENGDAESTDTGIDNPTPSPLPSPTSPGPGMNFYALEILAELLSVFIAEAGAPNAMGLWYHGEYLSITLLTDDLFESGGSILHTEALEFVWMLGMIIADSRCEVVPFEVFVHGHTDSTPARLPEYPSNLHLSYERARTIQSVLMIEDEWSNFSAEGFADEIPIAPNDTAEGRHRNRRVEIYILHLVSR